jgi:hypothetical protein
MRLKYVMTLILSLSAVACSKSESLRDPAAKATSEDKSNGPVQENPPEEKTRSEFDRFLSKESCKKFFNGTAASYGFESDRTRVVKHRYESNLVLNEDGTYLFEISGVSYHTLNGQTYMSRFYRNDSGAWTEEPDRLSLSSSDGFKGLVYKKEDDEDRYQELTLNFVDAKSVGASLVTVIGKVKGCAKEVLPVHDFTTDSEER